MTSRSASLAVYAVLSAIGCSSSSSPSSSLAGTSDGGATTDAGGTTDGGQVPPQDAGGSDSSAAGDAGGPGIAGAYPGDVGIGSDPKVLFFDDFESYKVPADLGTRWDNVYQMNETFLAMVAADVYAGKQALEFHLPASTTELANAVDKVLTQPQDTVYLRFYSKFDPSFSVPGSSHNGGSISSHYYNGTMATPGVAANGTNKFLVNLEDFQPDSTTMAPGFLNLYVYWPEQRSNYGDHFLPNGDVYPNTSIKDDFGPGFVSRSNLIPSLGEWHSYEYMVKANTPGSRDGEVTIWFDGALAANFGNLRFRDVATLTIDHIDLFFHAGATATATKKWYDNVVVAKAYVGPMKH